MNIALIDPVNNITITYPVLYNRVRKLSQRINSLCKGQLIFLFCENSVDDIINYLACLYSQNAVALLFKGYEFKEKLISRYKPKLIMGLDEYQGYLNHSGILVTNSYCEVNKNLKVLLTTSGSTGSPKFVRLTYRNLKDNAKNISTALSIKYSDVAITSLPMYYSYGLSVINSHLISGAKIVATNSTIMSKSFWDIIDKYHCSSLAGVPVMYDMIKKMDLDKLGIPSLRVLTQAGGKMSDGNILHFHEKMKKRNGKLFVMYGQTEAAARIAVMPPDNIPSKLGYVGKVLPNGSIDINHNGELIYSGKNVMMGYAECREDLLKGDELCGVLNTGDIGFVDPDGFIKITGRNKRFAKLAGNRVNLDELENILNKFYRCVLISVNDKVYVFCNVSEQEFKNSIVELYKITKLYHSYFNRVYIDELPINQNGKIDYLKLQKEIDA